MNERDNEEGFIRLDYIREDGSFVDNVCMVLLDVILEASLDFRCRTKEDHGRVYDPYLYGAQCFFWLKDPYDGYDKNGMQGFYSVTFFSGFGQEAVENGAELYDAYNEDNYDLAVRLEPGESKTITIGYVLGNNMDGTPRRMEDLCAIPVFQMGDSGQRVLVNLGLKTP